MTFRIFKTLPQWLKQFQPMWTHTCLQTGVNPALDLPVTGRSATLVWEFAKLHL